MRKSLSRMALAPTKAKLPFSSQEQSYAPRIAFQAIQMAHSTNFLNQEFTFVAGTIVNNGGHAIAGLQVAIEFHDQFNQTILRDSEMLIPPTAQRAMSKRAGSTVVEVKGSHAVYVSQPAAVAALIEKAARGVKAAAN